MIDLKRITKGRIDQPPRVLIYGMDGVGKTTMACGAPEPFVIDANRGSLRLDVKRVLVDSWAEVRSYLSAVESNEVKCKSLVLDSLTDLEAMSHAALFNGTTIDKFDGGYGRGETVAMGEWRDVIAQLERIHEQGKTIVIVAHCMVKRFDDPTGPGFDRFEVAARQKLAGMIRQWCDFVLFAREEVLNLQKEARATTTGVRWVYTSRSPAYDAKSRGTTLFPQRLPMSWADFAQAIRGDSGRVEEVRGEIEVMLAELADEKTSTQARDYLKEYPSQAVEVRNRVAAMLEGRKKSDGNEKQA